MPYKTTILSPPRKPEQVPHFVHQQLAIEKGANSSDLPIEIRPDIGYLPGMKGTIETFFTGQTTGEIALPEQGAINSVFFVHRKTGGDIVVKTERLFVNRQTGETFSNWRSFGSRTERRTAYDYKKNVGSRRSLHLAMKRRLESAGIETAEYLGSVVIPGYDQSTTSAINEVGVEKAMTQLGEKFISTPIYTEFWTNPGGTITQNSEDAIEAMYMTQDGRVTLEELADGLLELASQGFAYDTTTSAFGAENMLTTQNRHLPYPKNFMLTEDRRFVAIDFNLGVDLAKEEVWDPALLEKYPDGMINVFGGDLFVNYKLQQEYNHRLKRLREESLLRITQEVDDTNGEEIAQKYLDEMKHWDRMDYETSRLFAMAALAIEIKNSCKKFEKKDT